MPTSSLVSMKHATELTSLSRSTIYRRIADKRFPAPVSLGGSRIAFRKDELDRWISDPEAFLSA